MTSEMEAKLAADIEAVKSTPKHAEAEMERTIVVAYRNIDNSGDYGAAQEKFNELDVNHDGELNEKEVCARVEWVYATFKPPGYEPGAVDKKLLGKFALSRARATPARFANVSFLCHRPRGKEADSNPRQG